MGLRQRLNSVKELEQEKSPRDSSRRDFLKLFAKGTAVAAGVAVFGVPDIAEAASSPQNPDQVPENKKLSLGKGQIEFELFRHSGGQSFGFRLLGLKEVTAETVVSLATYLNRLEAANPDKFIDFDITQLQQGYTPKDLETIGYNLIKHSSAGVKNDLYFRFSSLYLRGAGINYRENEAGSDNLKGLISWAEGTLKKIYEHRKKIPSGVKYEFDEFDIRVMLANFKLRNSPESDDYEKPLEGIDELYGKLKNIKNLSEAAIATADFLRKNMQITNRTAAKLYEKAMDIEESAGRAKAEKPGWTWRKASTWREICQADKVEYLGGRPDNLREGVISYHTLLERIGESSVAKVMVDELDTFSKEYVGIATSTEDLCKDLTFESPIGEHYVLKINDREVARYNNQHSYKYSESEKRRLKVDRQRVFPEVLQA